MLVIGARARRRRLRPRARLPARLARGAARRARARRSSTPRCAASRSWRRRARRSCSTRSAGSRRSSSGTRLFPRLRLEYGESGGELGRAGALVAAVAVAAVVLGGLGARRTPFSPPTVHLHGTVQGPLVIRHAADARSAASSAAGSSIRSDHVTLTQRDRHRRRVRRRHRARPARDARPRARARLRARRRSAPSTRA